MYKHTTTTTKINVWSHFSYLKKTKRKEIKHNHERMRVLGYLGTRKLKIDLMSIHRNKRREKKQQQKKHTHFKRTRFPRVIWIVCDSLNSFWKILWTNKINATRPKKKRKNTTHRMKKADDPYKISWNQNMKQWEVYHFPKHLIYSFN